MSMDLKKDIMDAVIAEEAMRGYLYTPIFVKQYPFVNDDGIYMPVEEYVPEGVRSNYRLVLSKEMFVEAYNKWIKEDAHE